MALPFGIGATVWLGPRFAIVAALIAVAAASPWLSRARWERAFAAASAASCALALWLGHAGFDRALAPLRQLVEELPKSRIPFFSLYAHFASYYLVECGGSTPWLTFHVSLPWRPLVQHEPSYRQLGIADPFVPVVQSRRLVAQAARVRLVLARVSDERQLAALAGPYVPVMQAGPYWAFATSALADVPTCGASTRTATGAR